MTKYKIEKNIALIPAQKQAGEYPFEKMDIGDSFIVGDYSKELMSKYGAAARNWTARTNSTFKFSLRRIENNKIRMWRIK